jgi:arylsulfatase A-like enzyme
LNALHYADASLGTLIDGLRARNLYENTVFVIFGDHGEAFEQHPGNSGHTFFLYDENVHVPLLIAVPGVTNGPARSTDIASLIDAAPTLLDLLGLPASPGHEGASLLRPGRRMALFLTDYSLGWLGLRDRCFKYMFETGAARSKLFDVCEDPGETVDRSAAEPERVARYRDRVQQWSTAVTRSVQRP